MSLPKSEVAFEKSGVTMRDIAIDNSVVERAIAGTTASVAVISQSIAAGSSVLRGTPIDIVLAVTDKLPIYTIKDLPPEWQNVPLVIGEVATKARDNPVILNILEQHDSAATLDAQEKQALVDFGKSMNVNVNAGDPTSLQGAFDAAGGAVQLSSGG